MNRPTEPGLYWARSRSGMQWYDLIVEVVGEAPWLEIGYILDRKHGKTTTDIILPAWGPKICDRAPEVPKEEIIRI